MTLMDLMTVFDVETGWREMEQLGLAILLGFAAQKDIGLCSIASARLHTLLQTRPVDKLQESCYVMGNINHILIQALKGGTIIISNVPVCNPSLHPRNWLKHQFAMYVITPPPPPHLQGTRQE